MLYIVGLGLFDERDLSLRGLEALKTSDRVYAEFYTSIFNGKLEDLEALTGKKVEVLARSDLEEHPEKNIFRDQGSDVSLIVAGDPMVATTHSDIVLRAKKHGIKTKIIHSSSVFSAIAETGLQIYKFGKTTSIPYPEEGYLPTSPYKALKENMSLGLHTLCLLDIRAAEGRYMTVPEAISILFRMGEKEKDNTFNSETPCVGVARLGGDTLIRYGRAKDLLETDFGPSPHVLIVPGKLHFLEEEMLESFADE